MDLAPGVIEIFAVALGTYIRHRGEHEAVGKDLPGVFGDIDIAGENDRQFHGVAEFGAQIRLIYQFGEEYRPMHGAAVEPARQQEHIGPEGFEHLDLFVGRAAVIERDNILYDTSRPEGHPFGASGGDVAHETRHDDSKTSPGAGGRKAGDAWLAVSYEGLTGHFLQTAQGIEDTESDILVGFLHRRGVLGTGEGPGVVFADKENGLRGGTADVDDAKPAEIHPGVGCLGRVQSRHPVCSELLLLTSEIYRISGIAATSLMLCPESALAVVVSRR